MDTEQGGRFASLYLLSFGFHTARRTQWICTSSSKRGLWQFVWVGLVNAESVWTYGRRPIGGDRRFAYWGQNLSLHPHLHCIVPGGGTDAAGKWKKQIRSSKYLFPVKALSKVFRAKYVSTLRAKKIGNQNLYDALFKKQWVVYAKRPFGGPKQVIEYLGRYTHKVAISNHRIKNVTGTETTFNYKDYRQGGVQKQMTLKNEEFIRRFSMHILPKRFVRIRHYGILSSSWKRGKLQALQKDLKVVRPFKPPKTKLRKCPCCKTGTLKTIEVFGKRGPPEIDLRAIIKSPVF